MLRRNFKIVCLMLAVLMFSLSTVVALELSVPEETVFVSAAEVEEEVITIDCRSEARRIRYEKAGERRTARSDFNCLEARIDALQARVDADELRLFTVIPLAVPAVYCCGQRASWVGWHMTTDGPCVDIYHDFFVCNVCHQSHSRTTRHEWHRFQGGRCTVCGASAPPTR